MDPPLAPGMRRTHSRLSERERHPELYSHGVDPMATDDRVDLIGALVVIALAVAVLWVAVS